MQISLRSTSVLLALMAMPIVSAEKVVGAYIFARHGDRTPKVLGNTQLTDLGYLEVFQAGSYYHDRYIAANSSLQIEGISEELVRLSQISATAPEDTVLQNSAIGFLQGVYPPVGSVASQTLGNGKTVQAPLNGYQLIPLSLIDTNANSEDNTWLQAATGCQNAKVSSNNYYDSVLYKDLLASTGTVYQSLASYLSKTFEDSQMSFKSAYTIWDYLNVASIHNSSSDYPSEKVRQQLFQLANIEQYSLAYNTTDTARAVAGATLAGEMLQALNQTITSQGKKKVLNIQFGSYGTFLSYFGLAQLPAASVDFTGIPDYASSMAWELVTDSTADEFPSASEIRVRFVFHNGTITGSSTPSEFPLYGQSSASIPWSDFVGLTEKIAITSDEQWCKVCGNTDGQCTAYTTSTSDPSSSAAADGSKSSLSLPVAGVIGAMVTLAVILGLQALFLLFGGFRLTKKRPAVSQVETANVEAGKKA